MTSKYVLYREIFSVLYPLFGVLVIRGSIYSVRNNCFGGV